MAKKIKVSLKEQETTYNLYPKASGYPCEIYSCIPSEVAQIRKFAEQYPEEFRIVKEDQIAIFAEAPREWFKLKPPTRRNMTEEQKQALRDRLAAARESKKGEVVSTQVNEEGENEI